jgi:hypothetical protein
MFEGEWALLVRVTLYASGICANGESGLFEFKTAMRIMAIAALHGPFKNFVMERKVELMLRFGMTAHTKLRLRDLQ